MSCVATSSDTQLDAAVTEVQRYKDMDKSCSLHQSVTFQSKLALFGRVALAQSILAE